MSTTVTTATTAAATSTAFFASLALILAITLVLLLIKKEIFTNSTHPWAVRLTKVLNVAIVPLLMAFGMIVVVNILAVLR